MYIISSLHQKTCRNHLQIQNISVTLCSVIIAFVVCNLLIFNTLKLQQLMPITLTLIIYLTHVNNNFNYEEICI